MRAWCLSAIAVSSVPGCGPGTFTCADDTQCVRDGVAGVCQPSAFCSFPDDTCDSQQRYGEHAGNGLAGQCAPAPGGTDIGSSTDSDDTVADATTATTMQPATSTDTQPGLTSGPTSTSGTDDGPGMTTDSTTGPALDPDLVLWYRFDDPLADGPEDSSDSNLHGTCSACPTTVMGVDGSAGLFDGVSRFAEVPDTPLLDLTDELTVATWVRPEQWGAGTRTIAGRAVGMGVLDSWELYVYYGGAENDPQVNAAIADADLVAHEVSTTVPYRLDTWFHAALTWDGETMTLYLDGAPVDEGTAPSILYDDHAVRVAADSDNGDDDNFLPAAIDDFRIYARALTPREIATLAGW